MNFKNPNLKGNMQMKENLPLMKSQPQEFAKKTICIDLFSKYFFRKATYFLEKFQS